MLEIFNIEGLIMPFQEKSAWIMSFALLVSGLFYFAHIVSLSPSSDALAPPTIPSAVAYTVIIVIIAIVGHIPIAIFAPKDANARTDERERKIFDRAAHLSGYIFGAGVIMSLGYYLISYDGNTLFHGVFASLMLSQLAEYVLQICFYRTVL